MSNEYKDWEKEKVKELWERAMPKNPIRANEKFFWCPSCKCAIKPHIEDTPRLVDFCPYCGQALDWEGVV